MKEAGQPAEQSRRGSAGATPRSHGPRTVVALFGALAALLGISPAWAFPSARLDYAREPGAESCPDEAALRQAVADRLGYDPFDPSAPELLRARVSASAGRFSALLELFAASSVVRARRTIDSVENCGELVAALALSMSIAIDPEHGGPGETSEPRPATEGSSAPGDEQTKPPEEQSKPQAAPPAIVAPQLSQSPSAVKPRSLRIRAGASGHLAFGAEPAPAPGVELSLGVRQAAWSLTLAGRYDTETGQNIAPRGAVHARLRAGSLSPCFHARPALFCGVVTLGSLRARSSGLSDGRTDSALFAAVGARLGVEWPLISAFALRAFGELLVTARPLTGEVNQAPVWDVPPANGLLGAGFIAEF